MNDPILKWLHKIKLLHIGRKPPPNVGSMESHKLQEELINKLIKYRKSEINGNN